MALLALPASASAATTTSAVTGAVVGDLAFGTVAAPGAVTIQRTTTPIATPASVAVISTNNYRLDVHEASGDGLLARITTAASCATNTRGATIPSDNLDSPLEWSTSATFADSGTDLSSTATQVATGTPLSAAHLVYFRQPLLSTDAILSGDCYTATLTWTITAT